MNDRKVRDSDSNAHYRADELSLVDLVKSILRRRRVFLVTFAVVLAAGVIFALLKPKTYTYTSIYALASTGVGGKPLEEPAAALATLTSVYLPEQVQAYENTAHEDSLPFKVMASNPESTTLITLQSTSSVSHQSAIRSIQGAVLKELKSDDNQRLAKARMELKSQLHSLDTQLEALKEGTGNGIAIASTLQNKSDTEQKLASLADGRILALAKRSVEPVGISSALVIVGSVLMALVMGLFGVFVAEFYYVLKESDCSR